MEPWKSVAWAGLGLYSDVPSRWHQRAKDGAPPFSAGVRLAQAGTEMWPRQGAGPGGEQEEVSNQAKALAALPGSGSGSQKQGKARLDGVGAGLRCSDLWLLQWGVPHLLVSEPC